jgi:hypothetical protein
MLALWNQAQSPWPLEEILYEGSDFLFALLTGALAMAACRAFVPWARRPVIIFGAASIILAYAVLTILLHGKMPAYFFPIYLDLSAAIPGWLIGYYLAAGSETWHSFGVARIAALAGPAVLVVAAVVVAPLYMPFYMPGSIVQRPTVDATFQPVPVQQNSAASFTPPPASDDPDQMPTFHTVSPDGQ